MIINSFENLTEINQERLSTPEFINKVNADFSSFSNNNIIVILSSLVNLSKSDYQNFIDVKYT